VIDPSHSILVTGGTGSFGQRFVRHAVERWSPRRVIVFSRDELKQLEMRERFQGPRYECMRYFLGDVRDRERLYRAFRDVDVVVHAAALKQVPSAEYNPLEVVRTNILGAVNVSEAAIDCGVDCVLALSTDKAVAPVNLYGATKMCSDRLLMRANAYDGRQHTRFAVVRYGNVLGSRGSVVPLFLARKRTGVLPITDPRMTRFWITLDRAVEFVGDALERMQGGEIFVPKLPSMRVVDLARAIAPECEQSIVGIRPGEKLHEVLLSEDEARHAFDLGDAYAVMPPDSPPPSADARRVPESFRYASDSNDQTLGIEDLQRLLAIELDESKPDACPELR
jgi:UDP-N-acetylglucosamine 4,6-dehydratase/5-epimerase